MNRNLIFKLLAIPLCCLGIIMMLSTFYRITHAQDTKEPSVTITADVTTGDAPLAVSFTSTVNDPFEGKYPITYDWHFDDGAASTKQNPQHMFTAAKTYNVICRVTFWKSPKVTVEAAVNIKVEKKIEPIPVCTASGKQSDPQIIADGSNGAIITWMDTRSSNYDIYAWRIDSTGKLMWTADGVPICTAANNQYYPQLTSDSFGGAIITWQDFRSGNDDIYARRISSTGELLWTAGGVPICTAANSQQLPQIATDGSGGAVITWQDDRSGKFDIYAQRIDGTGKLLWTANGVAVCTAANNQLSPQITTDGSGGAIITWMDARSGESINIYAQRINSIGESLWNANGAVISTAAQNQRYLQITSDGFGGAIITWSDDRNGNNYDIYAQRIDSTGKPLWSENSVAICTAENGQVNPEITPDGSGGAVITWPDYRSVNNCDIYAQRVDSTGKLLWSENGVAICTADNNQQDPQITADGSGGAIITWYDYRSGSNYDIYARRIDNIGKPLWTADGVPISTAAYNQQYPRITSDGSGGAIIVWQEQITSTNFDIYAQRITKDGEVK